MVCIEGAAHSSVRRFILFHGAAVDTETHAYGYAPDFSGSGARRLEGDQRRNYINALARHAGNNGRAIALQTIERMVTAERLVRGCAARHDVEMSDILGQGTSRAVAKARGHCIHVLSRLGFDPHEIMIALRLRSRNSVERWLGRPLEDLLPNQGGPRERHPDRAEEEEADRSR